VPTQPHRGRSAAAAAACVVLLVVAFGTLGAGSAGAAPGDPSTTTTAPGTTTSTTVPPPPRQCPAVAGNARYVRYVYLILLNRCPDVSALQHWTGRLDRGLSRWSFAEAIDLSPESIGKNNVDALYQGLLGRPPTKAERDLASQDIRTNHQDSRVLAGIFGSDEYFATISGPNHAARDRTFLSLMFQIILDRDADPAGLTFFSAVLGPGESTAKTRRSVALALETSNERMAQWTFGVFSVVLDRRPDPAGFGYWFGWLLDNRRQTFRLLTRILSTTEAYLLAQTQPGPSGG